MVVGVELTGPDIFGVGKMVDEASEVLDSLDRPTFHITQVFKGKHKGEYTRVEGAISKLDMVFLGGIIAIAIIAWYSASTMGGRATQFMSGIDNIWNRMVASIGAPPGTKGDSSNIWPEFNITQTLKDAGLDDASLLKKYQEQFPIASAPMGKKRQAIYDTYFEKYFGPRKPIWE